MRRIQNSNKYSRGKEKKKQVMKRWKEEVRPLQRWMKAQLGHCPKPCGRRKIIQTQSNICNTFKTVFPPYLYLHLNCQKIIVSKSDSRPIISEVSNTCLKFRFLRYTLNLSGGGAQNHFYIVSQVNFLV